MPPSLPSLPALLHTIRRPRVIAPLAAWTPIRLSSSPSTTPRRPRRALLYVPGSDPRKLAKSFTSPADAIIYDLEDSVATGQKGAARQNVFEALQVVERGRAEKLVRINSGATGELDLIHILKAGDSLEGIVIPKVDSPDQVRRVAELIEQYGGEGKERIRIVASIESPIALMRLQEIATCSDRLDALLFASEDYCAASDLVRTPSRREMLYARSAIVATAKAYRLSAIDLVCVSYDDAEELKIESREGRELGFDGKQAIHPAQVAIIQAAFSPSPKDIARAIRILDEYERASASGQGAYGLEGEDGEARVMIDAPMLLQAQSVLNKAQAAGLDVGR